MTFPVRAVFAAATLAAATFARAQATSVASAATPPTEPAVKLEKFEVTGSLIPNASIQTALPLTVIDAKAIEDSGVGTNLMEVLHKVSPQFGGSLNIGLANSGAAMNYTAGGAAISFRNLQTLVLVNGRRMAYAPSLAAGGAQYVDVNLIPLAAIARVEVLQDGASATYGTDAVGGVLNIILRTDFQGAEFDARYAMSDNSGRYSEHSFSVVGGTGSGRSEITFSAELSRSDALPQYDRAFASPSYGTQTFAGVVNTKATNTVPQYYVLNPALTAPPPGHTPLATLVATGVYIPVNLGNLVQGLGPEQQYAFDLARYAKLLSQSERRSATLNFDHHLNDNVTLFGDFIYAATSTFSALNAQPVSPSFLATDAGNPTTQPMQIRNRFVDFPRLFYYDSASIRGILGARGTLSSDYKWEAAVDYNVIDQDFTNHNLVDTQKRIAAVDQNLLDWASRVQAPGAIESSGIFGTAWGKPHSTLTTADARVSGVLLDLPAGPLGFAVGAEYRVETLDETADPNSLPDTYNWDSSLVIYPFNESRQVSSVFAEIRVPLVAERQGVPWVRSLDLSAAVRYEHYSDAGDPLVPKVSLAWRPGKEDLLLRGTYSQSFAAPTLYNLFGPTDDNPEAPVDFSPYGGGDQVERNFHVRSGANPGLRPSHSDNLTYGFVWSPRALKGFTLTMDYFDVTQTDMVGGIGADTTVQDVELNGPASPYAQYVKFGGYDGSPVTAPGQLSADLSGNAYVTDYLVNIANQKLHGVDVKMEYTHGTATGGRIEASIAATYYQDYTYQLLPSLPPVDTVGLVTGYNGTLPRWQSYATVAWAQGPWYTNLNWQHIPGVTDPDGDGSVAMPIETEDYDAFDVGAAYTFNLHKGWLKRVVLRAGVNNVFNRMPPLDGAFFISNHADTGTYSPIGRLFYVEGKFEF